MVTIEQEEKIGDNGNIENRYEFIKDFLKERFGLTDLSDVITKPNNIDAASSDYKVLVEILRLFFEIDERDNFLRWLAKSNFRRKDSEILATIHAVLQQYKYDIYEIELEKYCLIHGWTREEYMEGLKNKKEEIKEVEADIRKVMEEIGDNVLYHFAVALMPAFISIDRKSRLELIDGVTARDKVIKQEETTGLFGKLKKPAKPPGV